MTKLSVKDAVKSAGLVAGIWLGRQTTSADIQSLLRKIRPLTSSRGLCRFGPAQDGGYLIPDDIDGIGACISPGVSLECGFDLDVAKRGIDVYMADASVEGPSVYHSRFHFTKKYIGASTHDNYVTIDDFCASIPNLGESDLILQMDIEGDEYAVLNEMSDRWLRRFRIIIVEMHNIDAMFLPVAFQSIKATFMKLTRHHNVVHAHPNNCCGSIRRGSIVIPRVMEFTLYRKDRDTFSVVDGLYPAVHPLDSPNLPLKPAMALPECWR